MTENTLTIDIYADIICPWCYIGKKRLEDALAQRPEITPEFRWRAFLLNPSMPSEGMDRQAYLTAKFGHAASAVYGRIAMAGLDAGISFNFSRISRTPDTRPLHMIMKAAGQGCWTLSEAFYQAYFIDGLDITDPDIQNQIYFASNMTDIANLQAAPSDKVLAQSVEQDLSDAGALGIEGVPYMVFNHSFAIAGAYPSDILVNAIDAAMRPA